jgi:putative ABC transport system ATP-binding protein
MEQAFKDMKANNMTIILERRLAKQYNLQLYDTIGIDFPSGPRKLRIVGFFGPEPSESEVGFGVKSYTVPMWSYIPRNLFNMSSPFSDARQLESFETKILLKLDAGVNGTAVAEQIRGLDLEIYGVDSFEEQWQQSQQMNNMYTYGSLQVADIQRLGLIFVVLAASVGTVLISVVSLRERTREATLMSVRGLSYRQLVWMFLSENMAVITFSVILGVSVGLIIVYGNITSSNAVISALVQKRLIFSTDFIVSIASYIAIIYAATIGSILIMTRQYVTKLERMVKMSGLDVKVRDLVKVHRTGKIEVQALRGLSMDVKAGELIAIIGPSGSGKTTLLNIVGGLDTATAGSVQVGDTGVTSLSVTQLVDYRRKIVGHIFQTLNLIPTLTAKENIEFSMVASGVPRGKRRERVNELLETVGLTDRAHHKPEELSGGEQQRIALAAALANDAPVLLADEPTGELDTVNARIVVDYLVKVNRELGKTIIMVTHDPSVARAAHRILRIEDGVIKMSLTPSEVIVEEKAVSYTDQLRARIGEINTQLLQLDEDFRAGKITGDEYTEKRLKLKQTLGSLREELSRMGVVP